MTRTNDNLEQRIADAIKRGASGEIGGLIVPADRAAREAEEAAEQARARALDPATSGSALAEARRQAEDAEFQRDRMAAAAERLREAHRAAQATEEDARRQAVYLEAQQARDAAASALAARYEALADELAGLLEAAAKADAMAERANAALPNGAARIPAVDHVRPGATPHTRPLRQMTLLAWHADAPPLWGRPERLGGGETYRRTRPAELEAEGNQGEAA